MSAGAPASRHPAELTKEQRAQVDERDHLVRAATLGVDEVLLNRRVMAALDGAPNAVRTRVIVTATIGFLIANGYTTNPDGNGGRWLAVDVPEHLRPDVDALVEANRQVRDAVLGHPDNLTARRRVI